MTNQTFCPKCNKPGFPTKRWVRSSYSPQYGSMDVFALQRAEKELAKNPNDKRCYTQVVRLRQTVTGTHFRGRNKKGLIIINEDEGCNDPYKTRSGKYYYDYFGHYDPEKYKQEMRDYKSGKRKSRPNGRKWCKI